MSKTPQMQTITLHKYCANGNDFLIFHTIVESDFGALAIRLCDRFRGIGADGLVVVLPNSTSTQNTAYKWDFYNSDGSKANMCGSASRCVGHYAFSAGLAKQRHSFLSGAGVIDIEVNGDIVQANLGKFHSLKKLGTLKEIVLLRDITEYMTKIQTSHTSLKAIKESKDSSMDMALRWAIGDFGGEELDGEFGKDFVEESEKLARDCLDTLETLKNSQWFSLNTGVPHLVCFLPPHLLPKARDTAQAKPILAILRDKFDANITIAHKIDDKRVEFATYERGVEGVTLSCGSGMAAALVVGYRFYGVHSSARLIPPSGEPAQASEDSNGCVSLSGAVSHIATCIVDEALLK